MSKKISRSSSLVRLSCQLLMIVCAVATHHAAAQQNNKIAPSSAAGARREAVSAATNEVLAETGEMRHLPPLGPVKSGVKSRDEIKNLIISRLNEDASPQELRANEAALREFGLIDADFRLRPFMINLLTEQIAGYYDPRSKQFYLADWIDIDAQQLVMSHELTHALQDQHFNLSRFEKWPKGEGDAELAAQALVEGDATLAMSFYMVRDPQRALGILKSMLSATGNSEQIDKAPRALRASLLFPYEQGRNWALEVYHRGGWDAVSKAFTDLPASTEQILHADKYFAREAPIKITLPNIAAALGRDWKQVETDVNGEWGYYLILGQFLPDDEAARKAAEGWGGDRFALYEQTGTERLCVAHLSAWDNEQEAREFFDAYAKRSELRYNVATNIARPSASDTFSLQTRDGAFVMERKGARVLVVEGLAPQQKERVLNTLRAAL